MDRTGQLMLSRRFHDILDIVAQSCHRSFEESQRFGFGLPAIDDFQHEVHELVGHLIQGFRTVDNWACIEVQVILHVLVSWTVAGDFDDRGDGMSRGCAATGGEQNDLCAACDHTCNGRGIVAGGIHDDETVIGDLLRIVIHCTDWTMSAFVDTAEGFLLQCG